MKVFRFSLLITFVFLSFQVFYAQAPDLAYEIEQYEQKIVQLDSLRTSYEKEIEKLKLEKIRADVKAIGLPSDQYVEHSAMILSYNEEFEQANWVAHMILPDIATGSVFRTNDFREDPKISTGTAIEQDYFLKYLQPDSSYTYDGYGYDRGHLAPSADFRWSTKALSESYYYSNMSPQLPDFNREAWAEMEAYLRSYVIEKKAPLYILTIPIFGDNPTRVERSINQLAIPAAYIKVALDLQNKKALAFHFPHLKIRNPMQEFIVSLDEVEEISGFNLFSKLDDELENQLESQVIKQYWFPDLSFGDVSPLFQPDLPPGHFNSKVGGRFMGKSNIVNVCGQVVSTRYSREGHLWINLDKNYPNHHFSSFIRKKDLVNFSFDPKVYLKDRVVCIEGNVENFNGTPTINISQEDFIKIYIPKK